MGGPVPALAPLPLGPDDTVPEPGLQAQGGMSISDPSLSLTWAFEPAKLEAGVLPGSTKGQNMQPAEINEKPLPRGQENS